MAVTVLRRIRRRAAQSQSVTSSWFDDGQLNGLVCRYRAWRVPPLSYATVSDFVDSLEHLGPLACAQGDLKDVQRPWVVKAILACRPPRARVLEIGAGQPYVADLLARLGYDVWIVDPYDGSGNGPVEYERYLAEAPRVTFVRERFDGATDGLAPDSFDAVYSISVLEHLSAEEFRGVVAGLHRFLKPDGVSIHAIDHVVLGRGAAEDDARLRLIVPLLGIDQSNLDPLLASIEGDPETYFLSAESHNRWRLYLGLSYEDYPMFRCTSVYAVSTKDAVASPDGQATAWRAACVESDEALETT